MDRAQVERLIEALKKWAMRVLPEIVDNMARQAEALQFDPGTAAELKTRLNRARVRCTYDPMYEAWSLLDEALKAGATV